MKPKILMGVLLILSLTAALFGCALSGPQDSDPTPDPPHTHTLTEWETEKAPTCTQAGLSVRRCTACDHRETKSIPATGHTWGGETVTKQPNCTETGLAVRQCETCKTEETREVPALGHQWKTKTVVKEATCTEDGEMRTDMCLRCNEGGTLLPIPATGHKWGKATEQTPAGCTTQGVSAKQCEVCGEELTEPIPATGHKMTEDKRKPASCTETGEIVNKCSVCGHTETEQIPATGHSYGGVQTDATGQYRLCSLCGYRDDIGNDLLYTIDVVNEEGCDFKMEENNSILIYKDSNIFKVLEANAHTEIKLPRGQYLVCVDNVGAAYLSNQVSMDENKPFTVITVRNNPDYDPMIQPVKEGDKMFNFLVKDTTKEAEDFQRLYEVAQGKKLVYIDFFYVACIPCESVLKEHIKMYQELPDDVKEQLLVILVDISSDSREYINQYREKMDIPDEFITMAGGGRVHSNVPNRGAVPYAVYLDADMTLIRAGGAGDLRAMIEKYITGTPQASAASAPVAALPGRKYLGL